MRMPAPDLVLPDVLKERKPTHNNDFCYGKKPLPGSPARGTTAEYRADHVEQSENRKNNVFRSPPPARNGEGRPQGQRSPHTSPDSRTIPGLPAKTGNAHRPYILELPRYLCSHSLAGEDQSELIVPEQSLINVMRLHDAGRMQSPELVLNRKVYDSMESNADSPGISDTSPGKQYPYKRSPYYKPSNSDDPTLVFESRFESGNLRRAIQVYNNEYDLVLRPDLNTNRHTQWYYFRVGNTQKGTKCKFNIINMVKSESLYEDGLRVLSFSEKEYRASGRGWHHTGENICYYQNNIRKRNGDYYYTLTWTLQFEHDDDEVYFAHCYPYTYSELQKSIRDVERDPQRSKFVRREVLCKTLAGNICDVLTITSPHGTPEAPEMRNRRGVVITARVHPGESNASWMMKGFLDYITGSSREAQTLRNQFVFKVVPMLNPDGVINGNYRCSLARVDLNRVWDSPSKAKHPTVYYTKDMMKRFSQERSLVLFADLHGHSNKKNIFAYGCERKFPNDGLGLGSNIKLQERLFPKLLHRNAPDIFSFADCNFKIRRSKENTARVVVWREFNLMNAFTIEASFAGASKGPLGDMHFTQKSLEKMGSALCMALIDNYCSATEEAINVAYKELEFMLRPRNVDRMSSASYVSNESRSGRGANSNSDYDSESSDGNSDNEDNKKESKRASATRRPSRGSGSGRRSSASETNKALPSFARSTISSAVAAGKPVNGQQERTSARRRSIASKPKR